MIKANFKFIGIGELTETAFFQCPIWIMYEDPEQDDEIKSWDVDIEKAWSNKKENSEDEYYFPYLGKVKPALTRGVIFYCVVTLASGNELFGYLTGGFAFCIFVEGRRYMFNINMPEQAKKTTEKLARALSKNESSIFPVQFQPISNLTPDAITYEQFW